MAKSKKAAKPHRTKSSAPGTSPSAPRHAKPVPGKAKGPKVAPAGKAPSAPEPPLEKKKWPKGGPTKADLKQYRQLLLEIRRELLSSSTGLAAEALQGSGGEFSVDHMADHGSDNFEQDFNLKLLEGEAETLEEVREALAKIDGQSELPYGLCEACADDPQGRCPTCPWIPADRLRAVPHARLCVQMKEREEEE